MSKTVIVIIVVVLAVLGIGGAIALSHRSDNKTTPATSSTPASNSTNSSSGTTTNQNTGMTITYSKDGFSPTTLTVKNGSQVTIKNDSSGLLQFDSDPHPVHTDDPELNVGTISPGQSKTVTVTTTGSHGYHNHLNPSDTGTLIVE